MWISLILVGLIRFELIISPLWAGRLYHLSLRPIGTPCRTRTRNQCNRSAMLYPVELMALKKGCGDLPHPCLRLRYWPARQLIYRYSQSHTPNMHGLLYLLSILFRSGRYSLAKSHKGKFTRRHVPLGSTPAGIKKEPTNHVGPLIGGIQFKPLRLKGIRQNAKSPHFCEPLR